MSLTLSPGKPLSEFVGERVKEQYGADNGGDLCEELMHAGIIREAHSVDEAARIVGLHL